MRVAVGMLIALLCLVGLACWSAAADAQLGSSSSQSGPRMAPLNGSLLVPGAPTEGEQLKADEEAGRSAPIAVAEREASATKFEGLSAPEAAKLTGEAFPIAIAEQDGGAPKLPAGQQLAGYLAANVARVSLPQGRHGVIESTTPMAIETSSNQWAPIDLSLSSSSASFVLARPATAVSIPKRLQEGVSLTSSGVSLTPVNAAGTAVGGSEGSLDGSVAFYGGVEMGSDVDVFVKPLTRGFEEDTILRSAQSPQQLSFKLGLPAGATVRQAKPGREMVEVLKEGQVLALVLPPVSSDAAGAAVPVGMSLSGDLLTLSVNEHAGEYKYPIRVDPTAVDTAGGEGSWYGYTPYPAEMKYEGAAFRSSYVTAGHWGEIYYETKGKSQIYAAYLKTGQDNKGFVHGTLRMQSEKEVEGPELEVPDETYYSEAEYWLCGVHACGAPEHLEEHRERNGLYFEQEAAKTGGEPYEVSDRLIGAKVYIDQEAGPSVSLDTTDEKGVWGGENPLYGNHWASGTKVGSELEAHAEDPGTGVYAFKWHSPNDTNWDTEKKPNACRGVQCENPAKDYMYMTGFGFGTREALPEGEDTVEVTAEDAAGLTATAAAKVKVDDTPPHFAVTGLPASHEIGALPYHFKVEATDGSGAPSSGVRWIIASIDNRNFGTSGGCSPGTCTVIGQFALEGSELGAGKHTLRIRAEDNVGNESSEEITLTSRAAHPVSVGPAAVNPVSGAFGLSATDVSIAAPDSSLSVTRSYLSRGPERRVAGPLGPQWHLSLGAQESLVKATLPAGAMVLTSADGQQTTFSSSGGGKFTAPLGDANLVFTEKVVGKETDYVLSDNGTATTFAVPSGGSGVWEPTIAEGVGGTNAVTYAYKTESGITEPTEELAPVPAGVSCSPTLKAGCRALGFVYAKETKASGEGPSEWNEYKGRLKEVTLTAFDPASKTMTTKAVAEYVYDKLGRLRAEWNPQVTPVLKVVYGYDSEGHLAALADAGLQPWLFELGTTPADTGAGRLLALARPSASTTAELKSEMEASAPANTTAPVLSSTKPAVGTKISVSSNGGWSNNPLAYTYQWEDCNTAGGECAAIPGAVNQSYYPIASDEGHTLVAVVDALNADGAVAASSAATALVATGTPNTPLPEPPSVGSLAVWTLDYQVPLSGTGVPKMTAGEVGKWAQTDVPAEATAIFPPDEPMGWPAKEYKHANIYYLDARSRAVNVATPTGGISTSEYNTNNDVVRTLSPDNRAAALANPEKSTEVAKELDNESTYNESGSEPGTELLSSLGPKHIVELTNGKKAEARSHTAYSYNEGAPTEGGPYHLVTKTTTGAQIEGKDEAASVHTMTTFYSGQGGLGWKLHEPTSVISEPSGLKITHTTLYEGKTGNVTESRMPAAGALTEEADSLDFTFGKAGSENGQFKEPEAIALTAGDEYVVDTENNRVEEFTTSGKFVKAFGGETLKKPRGIAISTEGNILVADTGHERIVEFSSTGTFRRSYFLYNPVGLAAGAAGVIWVVEAQYNRIDKCKTASEMLTCEYGKAAEGIGNEQFKHPEGIAVGAEGNLYISDTGNNRIDEYTSKEKYIRNIAVRGAKEGKGEGELKEPDGIATDANGDVWSADKGNNRVQEFSPTGTFIKTFGTEKNMNHPQDAAVDAEGNAWVVNTGANEIEQWSAAGTGYGTEKPSAHDNQTIYYSAGENTQVAACGSHPEWASLACQTQPAAQPEGSLPQLPVTKYTYNVWGEPESTTETVGTTTRTKTAAYDGAGRPTTTAIKTSPAVGTELPAVTYKYNEEQGALQEQRSTVEGKTKTLTTRLNTLGDVTSYTDATENTATYEYDIDGRIKKANGGKGTQTYSYDETTNLLRELSDSSGAAVKFTAKYDPEGNLLTEGYPNGMTANYGYDTTGAPITLEYIKTTHCTTGCTWFSDSVTPSIHGQWLEQTSTLSHQAYTYDGQGRLIQVQNTPVGKGCTTRLYTYEVDTNRTGLTTREPNAKGECASEGGTEEKHTYDQGDRLNDAGTSYNTFGDITELPPTDAGGKEPAEKLTSEYYSDNQLASQTQNGQTIGYQLDPAGRTIEDLATGKRTENTTLHYATPGDTPAWTSNTTGETTRNISGVTGQLAAVQDNTEAPVLQLTNLHGDIIATAYLSETATALASKADTTEYGVPTTSLPPKYSWLGALEVPTELPSGVIAMGARSYVPEIGRFLQPDPRPGGSANAYSYTFGDPINTSDPSGESTMPSSWSITTSTEQASTTAAPWLAEQAAKRAAEEAAHAAEEAAARRDAEGAALEAQWANWSSGYDASFSGGEEEWYEEEWYEEEGEYEYVAYHQEARPGEGHGSVAPAVLERPLGGAASEGEQPVIGVPLCNALVEGACSEEIVRRLNCRHPHCLNHWKKPYSGEPSQLPSPRAAAEAVVCVGALVYDPGAGVFVCSAEGASHLP